jgi:serine/threonine protein phosphatase PrpC
MFARGAAQRALMVPVVEVLILIGPEVRNMDKVKSYVEQILYNGSVTIQENRKRLFDQFCTDPNIESSINNIFKIQAMVMKGWELTQRISDLKDQSFLFPNASVGKYYEYHLDFGKLQIQDICDLKFNGLDEIGLTYDAESKTIKGHPTKSGDVKIQAEFLLDEQKDLGEYQTKSLILIINPDPKSLWKDLPSNHEEKFWKEDNLETTGEFLDRRIVISSKRGRSHANVGSARDDHFAYKNCDNGWSIIAVSDGAGSAKYSREGSKIACHFIIDYFSARILDPEFRYFDDLIKEYRSEENQELAQPVNQFVYRELGNAALQTHKKLEFSAADLSIPLKDLHSTLIFSLVKKYEFGYVILSFSVGDCPIALLSKDLSDVKLLNQLDVGDYGGGTRFITMPEIFTQEKLQNRFSFKIIEDFSYLMLMTDGIYDPKFVTESNLESIEKWSAFILDLKGQNADEAAVVFDYNNENIAFELSKWMDFWESGNHDDRTLAIIF